MDPTVYLMGFGLILTRVSLFIAACPTFVNDRLLGTLKGILAFLLAASLYASHPVRPTMQQFILGLLVEALLGAAFGMSTRMVTLGIHFAGELIDTNIGFGFARMLDPMISEEAGPTMTLAELLGGLAFFMVGGQRWVIAGLDRSLVLFEPGVASFDAQWVDRLCEHFFELITLGLIMAMPVVLTLVATQAALALLSRVAPQMNVWAVGLLGTCGMGIVALWCFAPGWVLSITSTWQQHGNNFIEVPR